MSRINVTCSSMPPFDEYIEELKPVWDSRWLSNRGQATIKLEEELKKKLGCKNICMFGSGHVALECALQALDMKGEIITTPYTFISTTEAIVRRGFTPVFVDIKEDNYTINDELIEQAITDKTVAIVATHVYGFLCEVIKIEKIAKKYNLKVIYDAAHAFGVSLNGVNAANFGDASMFSTHATKVFHTIEGGFVTYNDEKLFNSMKHIINFGFTSQEDAEYIGTNARMNEFEAVMGLCNLRYVGGELEKRRVVCNRYFERLDNIKGIRMIKPEKGLVWNYAYFPVVFDGYRKNRNEIKAELEVENIFARKYFYPITNKFTCFKNQYGHLNLPVAEHISNCVLTLPLYANLSLEDVDRICDIILR